MDVSSDVLKVGEWRTDLLGNSGLSRLIRGNLGIDNYFEGKNEYNIS